MALFILHMQPAVGDLSEIDIPANVFRQLLAMLTGGASRIVVAPTSKVVTQRGAGANFSVDVQPFYGIIAGEDTTDQGSYLVVNTAVLNVATPTAPASGTRTHRLVAQVRDYRNNATWGAGTYDWQPLVLQDTGSGEPARPNSAMTLADLSIAAGQAHVDNANITVRYGVGRNLLRRGPWVTNQINPGSWNSNATWNDFTGANWPPVSFTVPPSGAVYVTVSGSLTPGSGANASLGWRISGGDTVANTVSAAFTASASGTSRGSRRSYVPNLTPGATDTLTPGWFQSASGSSDSGNGDIVIEAAD